MANMTPVEGATGRPRCPACRVELRIRDDKATAPVFPCPECRTPLRLDHTESGALRVVPAETPLPQEKPSPTRKKLPPAKSVAEHNDQTVWWIGGGLVLVTVIVMAIVIRNRAASSMDDVPVTENEPQPPVRESAVKTEAPPSELLVELAERIRSATQTAGHFPPVADAASPLPPAQQLSWLGQLEARSATLPAERRPAMQLPWNDPANEPFVGRRVAAFLNPQVAAAVGEDRRPATHFVGVAGVGRDAVDLPPGHPRAGLFGTQRKVTNSDVRDGLTNTLMVLGVDAQLGSWADPGRATVRALTQPPYLHGPDGFGGGPDQPLPALMADGSVRKFAADTDPRLLRRLAAIQDGLPLDLSVPGEPGDSATAVPSTVLTGVRIDDPEQPSLSALSAMTEARRPIIVRPATGPLLTQRLVSFQQTKPATRRQLLLIAEDFLGRPVVLDQESLRPVAAQLDANVTFTLENTTLAAVLEQVLSGTDLELVIGAERAIVRKKTTPAAAAVRIEP